MPCFISWSCKYEKFCLLFLSCDEGCSPVVSWLQKCSISFFSSRRIDIFRAKNWFRLFVCVLSRKHWSLNDNSYINHNNGDNKDDNIADDSDANNDNNYVNDYKDTYTNDHKNNVEKYYNDDDNGFDDDDDWTKNGQINLQIYMEVI